MLGMLKVAYDRMLVEGLCQTLKTIGPPFNFIPEKCDEAV